MLHEFTSNKRIAYFSMEIALEPDIPTYAGGLGVLAGDFLRSAAGPVATNGRRYAGEPRGLFPAED